MTRKKFPDAWFTTNEELSSLLFQLSRETGNHIQGRDLAERTLALHWESICLRGQLGVIPCWNRTNLIRRFVDEMLNKRNSAIIDELVAPDFMDHDAPHHQAPGPEGVRRTLEAVHRSLTDFVVHMDDIIAEGDRVVARQTAEATHAGPFLGFAPTGRRLRWMVISIYRIADGRIAERWGLMDYRSLQRQLGA